MSQCCFFSSQPMHSSNSCKFLSFFFLSFFLQQIFLENRLWKNTAFTRKKKTETHEKWKVLWRALGKHIKSKSRPRSAWCEWKNNIYSAEQCVWKWLVSRQDGDVFWHASLVEKQYLLATWDQAHSSSPERRETARLHKPRIRLCRVCQSEMQSIVTSLFKGPVADVALLPEYPSQSHLSVTAYSSYTESEEQQHVRNIQCCTNLTFCKTNNLIA